jgi:hypothetical protein
MKRDLQRRRCTICGSDFLLLYFCDKNPSAPLSYARIGLVFFMITYPMLSLSPAPRCKKIANGKPT